jgi:hypothetical protein
MTDHRLDEACDRFEAAWRAGCNPRIEEYLQACPAAGRPALFGALLAVELELRGAGGEGPDPQEYHRRFPEHPEGIVAAFGARPGAVTPPPAPGADGATASHDNDNAPARRPSQALEIMDSTLDRDLGSSAIASASPLLAMTDGRSPGARYEILGELGHGGMGVVYRVHDRKRREVVALKTGRSLGPSALERFKREFRALAGVVHANLVTLHELISDGRGWYFTMELVDGVDFLTHVRPEGGGPDPERLRVSLRQLVEGVAALHAAGRLHRDLKPSNVRVTALGRVVVLDFGLAAELDPDGRHQSTESHLLGTIAYMAPEQASGDPVGPPADWYSVGVMLYEALTGRLPFSGGPAEVLAAKRGHEPPTPRALAPEIPTDLETLCAGLLRRDPEARPTSSDILRALGSGSAPVGAPQTPVLPPRRVVPLVGRQGHLEILRAGFEIVRRGQPVVICLSGQSGAGKTALARCFLDELTGCNAAIVLTGRCYEQESVPYKALDGLVDELSRYLRRLPAHEAREVLPRDVLSLARVFPVLRRVDAIAAAPSRSFEVPDPHELRRRAFAALRELLARLGDRRPVVLFLDDLQWGDLDSATLLADLLKPPDPPALLALASFRSEEIATSPFLRGLAAWREQFGTHLNWQDLAVEPLVPGEAQSLARALLASDDPAPEEQIVAIARESGGSPFFIHEFALSVRSRRAGGRASPAMAAITLDGLVMDRVASLPETSRRLLEVVAVAGRPIRRRDAVQAAGLGAEEHAAELLLRAGRLIRSMGISGQEEIETYHDRIREAIIAHLEPAVRKGDHHRLACALESTGEADPEFLAEHFYGAGEFERAGRYYANAANLAAGALAFNRAVKLYRQALELHPAETSERLRLRVNLGDALANAGRGAEAAHEYLSAAAGADPDAAFDLRFKASMQLLFSGHVDEGLETVDVVLKALRLKVATTPRRAILSYLIRSAWLKLRGLKFHERDASQVPANLLRKIDVCWSMALGLSLIDVVRGADFQARNLLQSLSAGEPFRIARALALEVAYTSTGVSSARSRSAKLLRSAEVLARRLGHPYLSAMIDLAGGIAVFLSEGRWSDSLTSCDRAERIFRDYCKGTAWPEIPVAQTFALWCLIHQGKIAELSRRWPVLLQESRERGDLLAVTNLSTHIMALVRLGADQPEDAQRELDTAMRRWSQQLFSNQHMYAVLAQLDIHLYRRNGQAAWAHISERWPFFKESLLLKISYARADLMQLRARSALLAAMTAPDPRPLLRSAGRDAQRLAREKLAWAEAHAQAIRAGIAAVRGEWSMAVTRLTDAAARYDAADMGLYAAASRRRLGLLLGGDEGRDLVRAADAWMSVQIIRNPARMAAMYTPGFPD